jgi:hypothetical protein
VTSKTTYSTGALTSIIPSTQRANILRHLSIQILLIAVLTGLTIAPAAAENEARDSYRWRAELSGPTQKCGVPAKIPFVAADAIITGRIVFRGRTYYTYGRLEDTSDMEMSLIRFHDDAHPLLTLTALANGTWNGGWTSKQKGCGGKVRVMPR